MAVKICLVVIGDGRWKYLKETLASFDEMVTGPVTNRVMVNDSGYSGYHDVLLEAYGARFDYIRSHPQRMGVGAAIQSGWELALMTDCTHVFHLEEDFTFDVPLDLTDLVQRLEEHPHLCQIALRRDNEGVPLFDLDDPRFLAKHDDWVELMIFTNNPSLIPRDIVEMGYSESEHGQTLKHTPLGRTAGYVGHFTDEPVITHIGECKSEGYLP